MASCSRICHALLIAAMWMAGSVLPARLASAQAAPRTGFRDPLDPMYRPPRPNASTIPSNVWVTDGMAKMKRQGKPAASQSIEIYAAKNEFESFQVHVLAASNPIQLTVTVSDFVSTTGAGTIPSATNVVVYREAYLNITTPSDLNGKVGTLPDPLIPAVDPYYHETRNAFPVTVPLTKVQSTWVDVLVPQNATSGFYASTVTVYDGTTVLAQIPVTLVVWDFAIPSTATLKSAYGLTWDGLCVQAYGSYANCGQFPSSNGSADAGVEMTHVDQATMFLDHRITLSGVPYYGPPIGDWTHFDATYGALMNGTAGTMLPGAALTSLVYTVGGPLDPADLQDWMDHFMSNGWQQDLFQYTCDEPPNGCTWDEAAAWNDTVHTAAPNMQTLITTNIDNAMQYNLMGVNLLTPVVDEMEPQGDVNQRPQYDAWLAQSPDNHLWWYQSCDEHESCTNGAAGPTSSTWPSYMIDAAPVRNRVFQWLAYLDRIDGELYYLVDRCFQSPCVSPNPWVSVYASGGNGDGTLIYPGTVQEIGGITPIALPSIRLKLIRDGMEDFEYLNLLANAGQDSLARSIAATFITNAYTFNTEPKGLRQARLALGTALHKLGLAGQLGTHQ